jgi:hypothetical protein
MAKDIVEPRVTDAVTQASLLVVGTAPAIAMASLYQTLANSVAMASMAHQAATVQSVALLLSLGK